MSKSPLKVLAEAYRIGQEALPLYSHPKSPQTFTQPQLFACLVLKAFFLVDYRGIVAILEEWTDLRTSIGLKDVPHFTTLQKAERRILGKKNTQRLLQETIKKALSKNQIKEMINLAAIDGSGFESRHVSGYFVERRASKEDKQFVGMSYQRYPKLTLLCDCASHFVLGLQAGRGPKPDIIEFKKVVKSAASWIRIKSLVADAGYDSEENHQFCRGALAIESIIPPLIGRPSPNLPSGHWRRKMAVNFPKRKYGQRWQVETVFSMFKRVLRSALTARQFHSQCRELYLKALTFNIMLLKRFFLG